MGEWEGREDAGLGERDKEVWNWVEGQHVRVGLSTLRDESATAKPSPSDCPSIAPEWIRDYLESFGGESKETLPTPASSLWFDLPSNIEASSVFVPLTLFPERLQARLRSALAGRAEIDWERIRWWGERERGRNLKLVLVHPSRERQALASSAIDRIGEMLEDFDNLGGRLVFMIEIKKILRNLWILGREKEDKYSKQIAVMLHESLKNAYAEEMTEEQILAVKGILSLLTGKRVTLKDARTAQSVLLSHGLDYMPSVESEESSPS